MLLGSCLVLLGLAAAIAGIRSSRKVAIGPIPLKTAVLILGGVWVFAVLITSAGLAVSLLALLLISCADRLHRNAIEIAITYLVLLALTWFIFIRVIRLPISLF